MTPEQEQECHDEAERLALLPVAEQRAKDLWVEALAIDPSFAKAETALKDLGYIKLPNGQWKDSRVATKGRTQATASEKRVEVGDAPAKVLDQPVRPSGELGVEAPTEDGGVDVDPPNLHVFNLHPCPSRRLTLGVSRGGAHDGTRRRRLHGV